MENSKKLGLVSAAGFVLLLGVIAALSGGYNVFFRDLPLFLRGDVGAVVGNETSFLLMFAVIMAVVTIEIVIVFSVWIGVCTLLGVPRKSALAIKEGNLFFNFFLFALLEEIGARWLFLGAIPKVFSLSGPAAFYILCLTGNTIWAFVHIYNYEKNQRHIIRVLPQFLAGFFFTYVYIKYGLLAAVLTHLCSNLVIFSVHKLQDPNLIDLLTFAYSAICVAVSYALMQKPISDILPWFSSKDPHFALSGWGFWDYLAISVFISYSISALSYALLLDKSAEKTGERQKIKPSYYLFFMLIFGPFTVGALYGMFAFLGLFFNDIPHRILILAIFFAFFQKLSSGSATARVFITSLPGTYMAMCIIKAMGFWSAVAFLLLETLVNVPLFVMNQYDD